VQVEKKKIKTVYVGVRVLDEEAEALQEFCNNQQITISDLLRTYIRDVLEKYTDYKPKKINISIKSNRQ